MSLHPLQRLSHPVGAFAIGWLHDSLFVGINHAKVGFPAAARHELIWQKDLENDFPLFHPAVGNFRFVVSLADHAQPVIHIAVSDPFTAIGAKLAHLFRGKVFGVIRFKDLQLILQGLQFCGLSSELCFKARISVQRVSKPSGKHNRNHTQPERNYFCGQLLRSDFCLPACDRCAAGAQWDLMPNVQVAA